jgi:hypothetical protein
MEMTSFTGKRTDNKSSPARSYAQAASNRFEALSDDDEMEDVIADEYSTGDSSNTTPIQDNAKSMGTKDAGAPKKVTNLLSEKALRKAAQEKKKNTKDDLPLNLSSATKATLECAKKTKEALQNSGRENIEENFAMDNGNMVDENIPSNKGPEEYLDSTSILTEESKEGCFASLEDHTSTAGSSNGEVNNNVLSVPTLTRKPDPRTRNPYDKTRSSQGILHAVPQGKATSTSSKSGDIDKQIMLKKGMLRPHIH